MNGEVTLWKNVKHFKLNEMSKIKFIVENTWKKLVTPCLEILKFSSY